MLTFIATKPPGSPYWRRRPRPPLHGGVDREHEVVAGPRLALGELPAGGLPAASTWTLVAPLMPAQQRVVGVLDPGLADLVAGLEVLVARVLELLLVDLADVAEHVRGQRPLRIVADVDALDRDAGEPRWFSRR